MSDEGKERRPDQVQSVVRAADVLHCFIEAPVPHSLTEIARGTGLTLSTAYRLLRTLCACEMTAFDPVTERYKLGPALVRLARSAFVSAGLTEATDVLSTMARETGESTSLGVLDGPQARVLLAVRSGQPLGFDRPPGERIKMHASAMGKVLIGFGRGPIRDVITSLGALERFTERTICAPDVLEANIVAAVERGYALSDEERYVGVRTIAVPVYGSDGLAVAAAALQGPTVRLTDDRLDVLAGIVHAAARRIEAVVQPELLA